MRYLGWRRDGICWVRGLWRGDFDTHDGRWGRQMVGLLLASDFVGRPGRAIAAYDVTALTDVVIAAFANARLKR
jgi:hypothetical protein